MSQARPNPEVHTPAHADDFPTIDVWENKNPQRDYVITIRVPEFTSVCPMTGLPDFGAITVAYVPDAGCVELKAFKYYILAYRNFGMFYENVVNKIADDIDRAAAPRWLRVKGVFTPRGGISTDVVVERCKPGYERFAQENTSLVGG